MESKDDSEKARERVGGKEREFWRDRNENEREGYARVTCERSAQLAQLMYLDEFAGVRFGPVPILRSTCARDTRT